MLKKELTLFNVYAIATGTTLSAGFFLLPGIAFNEAGPAVVLSYLIAAIPLIPAMFSMVELATAMPRAGGAYYFLDRSMGPFVGTIGGLGTWLALVLKTAFALIGMGAYLRIFWPEVPVVTLAIILAVFFGIVNLFGARKTGTFQVFMVFALLLILFVFIVQGVPQINLQHFEGFFDKGGISVISTAGLVYISYVGITNIASVAEEIENPERNLPLGVFLAIATAIAVYAVGTTIMVGVLPAKELAQDLTPVASAAEVLFGNWGKIGVTVAAVIAFASVANAGILSASRYPLAMSRDHLIPGLFSKLTPRNIPHYGIAVTVGLIIFLVLTFDIASIAKLASAFQLMMFALICFAVIVMRESRIEAYDPGYRSPFYPWMQLFGVFSPMWLIAEMGIVPILFSLALVTLGTIWYISYARERVVRSGAIYHLFARLGEQRFEGLDRELRGIMKEKGVREEDPFDEVVTRAQVMEFSGKYLFEEITHDVAKELGQSLGLAAKDLEQGFMEGSRIGATPISHGAALPHIRLAGIDRAEMVIVRAKEQCLVEAPDFSGKTSLQGPIHAFFFLVSPNENPGQHLRILAQIAGRVDDENFLKDWLVATDEQELKEILLRDERFLSLRISSNTPSSVLIGRSLREIRMPEGSLVALIRRKGETIIPRGLTVLQEGDRLTIIGDAYGIEELNNEFS
ncbi:MAG TPA: amino acid permease [Candidatus Lambdaproteobacteria bacterium]|nr:amino acid permease [SAR324 cluster bacterium]HHZ79431.1 amino acid permease [Candidatus Lambdaproteobacteria bacterium]